ncbi:beta-lactamase [Myxococcus stipitatus DSM 14675]|uniref:Beta-lactamase n=1 Tax=Myxococcus stipitatus (strain DSM 14675 / JCM 12634 / Mx s8) TaxID=1278073 RepID=L7UC55_MYXSD|nr:serine hydrolase domain-containing protein [Myxococcus stipitatus]AGC44049.1 beta-lactamase [Myxococcus stipitatus DSM 14675]
MRAVPLLALLVPLSLAQARSPSGPPPAVRARDGRDVEAARGTLVAAASAPAFVQVIEREVPALMKEAHIPGAAVGLIVGGKLVYAKGFGFADHAGKVPVTADTVFIAASLSKPIASWVAMRLAEQGRVRLDAPVADVLSPWPLPKSPFDPRLITIRRLLSHTAGTTLGGYQGWLDFKELPTLEESLAGKTNGRGGVELFAPAGAKFQYSGGGYTLMQLAIERTTQRKYADLARELVFRPLGMKHSSVAMTPEVLTGAAQGHGDDGKPVPMRYYVEQAPSTLSTSLHDFARWMIASMANTAGAHPLTPAQLAQLYTPAELSTPRAPGEAVYGLGHFIERLGDGSTAVGHDGRNQAGFRAKFLMRPQSGDGIVFFSNARTGLALDHIVCLWGADVAKVDAATACKK